MKAYKEEVRVKSYHVDRNQNLSTVQIFNFLQEAAFRHSVVGDFGQPALAKLGLVWMISRMKVVFLEDVTLGDTIEIKSWVRSIKGALSERDFVLTSGDSEIVKATSLWACLSINPVKPVAIPVQITDRMCSVDEFDHTISTAKIEPILGEVDSHHYTIKPSDIDMVNHTNNVAYVRLMLDTLKPDQKLLQLDVNYLFQSYEGDELSIGSESVSGKTQIHEISDAEGKVICRLKTEYK